MKTGLAVIHKGETYSGVNNKGGGDVILNLNYMGMPMGIDRYEQRYVEDKRIIDVWANNVQQGGTAKRVIREVIAGVE